MLPNLIDQIRQALAVHVKHTGESYQFIARACDIWPASLYRFRAGKRDLSPASLDRLSQYLGLEVRATKQHQIGED